ncbi:hypothetical protein [Kitasatospora fiedleri]|uniref:hypothetical protein n=1 Tax=Kitasatospora fiedleri TaxID=2991545 RepID=UPI00249B8FC3|nr:hypothetical protein [Kitasatospora fiedleri]
MDTITVLHRDAPGAPARIAAAADEAQANGYQNVQTHYEPATGLHTVTGEPPAGQ